MLKPRYQNLANDIKHHPFEWWDDINFPERLNLLRNVIGEVKNDSEDMSGKPQFDENKSKGFQDYLSSLTAEAEKTIKRRELVKQENIKLENKGHRPLNMPAEFKPDPIEIQKQREFFKK